MHLFEFLDKVRAESDYPGAQMHVTAEHSPDPRILPEDVFDKEYPRPTEDDRSTDIDWKVTVSDFSQERDFWVTTDRQMNVSEVRVEGLLANYLVTVAKLAERTGVR